MHVIGLCRFSYVGHGGYRAMHNTLQERAAYLYAPERLEERFRLFESLALPSVRGQTDPDFTFLIVISDTFPAQHLARLRDLVADIPQAVVKPMPPGRHRPVMREAINQTRMASDAPCLQFRLDDDDAMGCSFVARLRETATLLRSLLADHPCLTIDFNQGYMVQAGPDGLRAAPYKYGYSAIAMGMMLRSDSKQTVIDFSHHKVWRMMPTMTFTGDDMMLRGHNVFNDSRQKSGSKPIDYKPLTPAEEAHFKATFNVDNAHVRRVFSAM